MMLILGPATAPMISAVSWYWPSSSGSLMTLPSSTTSTAGRVTLDPTSPARVSTVRTSSTAAFSCLPPQRTIAYTQELSLCLRGPIALFRGCGPRTRNGGLASLAPGTLTTQPWIRPVRWVFRLSDPGGGRCLRRRLPGGSCGHVGRTRLPTGSPPPPLAARPPARPAAWLGLAGFCLLYRAGLPLLCRAGLRLLACPGAVAGRLGLARPGAVGTASFGTGPAVPGKAGGRGVPGEGRVGTADRGGRLPRLIVLAGFGLPLPPAVLPLLAVPWCPGGRAVGPAPVTGLGVVHSVHEDQPAAPITALARLGERLKQPGAHPLAGHLHQPERGHLGHLV